MYSYEIQDYLENKSYKLTLEEYYGIVNTSPQISSVKLTWNEDVCGAYISWAGNSFARMSSSICGSTLDEVNLYLKDNPITMDYVLATPVFEPLADKTLPYLSTYEGVTNISNDDALSAEMTVKYPTTDASGVGSRNESRIADIEGDVSAIIGKLGGLTFSASGTTLTITDGTHTWTLEANN